ncbi:MULTISPECIES: hypothetical protein [unclassified Novosphingobium]|uniref:hypothetical protein n=1 Tax=unclassified Novosphingobium TaxID=2644732 RepID=UPI001493F944|nr:MULTISPECIES: hypothetical protein [unclassified Novosphingobium]MBB3356243.1 hypothetical protein [Novosphingobium sp. BK256]MBB3372644.1 hypothetical protein [Novosphingobium sp. BK280]MBB3377011.1 hypothetical protein [Novosphingobium sp. BK258]MBB3419577.1 hypothetical protein [Novosphingobium sp. BK267]MBB3448606.1 hypothetical protein [Novosphingobium sp. BK352]
MAKAAERQKFWMDYAPPVILAKRASGMRKAFAESGIERVCCFITDIVGDPVQRFAAALSASLAIALHQQVKQSVGARSTARPNRAEKAGVQA